MKLPKPLYINSAKHLDAWIRHCRKHAVLSLDTESDSMHHFQERVCLIQMSAGKTDALIDPLAMDSATLQALHPLFTHTVFEKIFHDATYDLLTLRRDFGFVFKNIFDTKIACRLLGKNQFGLASLLQEYFNEKVSKKCQRSDWRKRPLSLAQTKYAQIDTHFLERLADNLREELDKKGRLSWALEDCKALENTESACCHPSNSQAFWRIPGVQGLKGLAQSRAWSLCKVRSKIAKQLDMPVTRLMRNRELVEIAKRPPRTSAELRKQWKMDSQIKNTYAEELLSAVARPEPITDAALDHLPKQPHLSYERAQQVHNMFQALRKLRKKIASDLEIEPDVLLGNAVLKNISLMAFSQKLNKNSFPQLWGWRKPFLLEPLKRLLKQMN